MGFNPNGKTQVLKKNNIVKNWIISPNLRFRKQKNCSPSPTKKPIPIRFRVCFGTALLHPFVLVQKDPIHSMMEKTLVITNYPIGRTKYKHVQTVKQTTSYLQLCGTMTAKHPQVAAQTHTFFLDMLQRLFICWWNRTFSVFLSRPYFQS